MADQPSRTLLPSRTLPLSRTLPKLHRLTRTEQFQRVFAARCSAADAVLVVFALPNELPYCRLGLSVSKKVGNAVVRNRWKRLIREAFRHCSSTWQSSPRPLSIRPGGFDIVVLPKKHVDVRSVKNAAQSLEYLISKIAKRITATNLTTLKPTVLLTRPQHQAEPMQTELESLGFHVLLQPAIDILPPDSWSELDAVIRSMGQNQYDWLVFSSSNGVDSFFNRLDDCVDGNPTFCPSSNITKIACHKISVPKIAVVGHGTDSALCRRLGRRADVVPNDFTAEGVVQALSEEASQGKSFLLLRASRGRDVLKKQLAGLGGTVTEIAVYRSVDRVQADAQIIECLRQGQIDYITITSSAIAHSLVNMFGNLLRHSRLVSISPLTSQTLCSLGFPPDYESDVPSHTGMIWALEQAVKQSCVR